MCRSARGVPLVVPPGLLSGAELIPADSSQVSHHAPSFSKATFRGPRCTLAGCQTTSKSLAHLRTCMEHQAQSLSLGCSHDFLNCQVLQLRTAESKPLARQPSFSNVSHFANVQAPAPAPAPPAGLLALPHPSSRPSLLEGFSLFWRTQLCESAGLLESFWSLAQTPNTQRRAQHSPGSAAACLVRTPLAA